MIIHFCKQGIPTAKLFGKVSGNFNLIKGFVCMYDLKSIQPALQNIISLLEDSLHLEVGIIDSRYKLVAFSRNYLSYKGKEVYRPSVQKIFDLGDVVVPKPGCDEMCQGCRFEDNCPSAFEVLKCIKFNNNPIGIITLCSFRNKDNDPFCSDIDSMEKAMHDTSKLIANIIGQVRSGGQGDPYRQLLRATMNLSDDVLICTDNLGKVISYNKAGCELVDPLKKEVLHLDNLLPANKMASIMNGAPGFNFMTKINRRSCLVSGSSVNIDGMHAGAVIRITPDESGKGKALDRAPLQSAISLYDIKGESTAFQTVIEKVKKIANSPSTVFLTGETGTGKELFAQAIHTMGCRRSAPFVAINCAAIPETLLESELFGYEKGAFTGARRGGKAGLLEVADGGILFLDEITEMSPALQVKLLRVLQERYVQRIGSHRPFPLDVRIIATANRDVEALVAASEFRSDLYYRLNVIPIHLPPLRMRNGDVEILARHFLDKYCRLLKKQFTHFTKEAINALNAYSWPGNVRELENAVEYAVNIEDGEVITAESLPEKLRAVTPEITKEGICPLKSKIDCFECNTIREALELYGSDLKGKQRVAKELGVGLRTLYRKLERYNLP